MARTESSRRRDRTLYTAPMYLPWHIEAERRWPGSEKEGNGCWAVLTSPKEDDSPDKRVVWLYDDPLEAIASVRFIEADKRGLVIQSEITCLFDTSFLVDHIRSAGIFEKY